MRPSRPVRPTPRRASRSTRSADSAAPTTAATPATTAATAAALVEPSVGLEAVGTFTRPVDVAVRPADGRLFVIEQDGTVTAADDATVVARHVRSHHVGRQRAGPARPGVPPDRAIWPTSTTPTRRRHRRRRVRRRRRRHVRSGHAARCSTIDQPYANHNGGELAFGPDGMLYIGMGDGGSGGDPNGDALNSDHAARQDPAHRSDAADGDAVHDPGRQPVRRHRRRRPEIWSIGLRNPWRFSFDPATGDLWIADVGQDQSRRSTRRRRPAASTPARGSNFGWSAFEGDAPFNADQPADGAVGTGLRVPHARRAARSAAAPSLRGDGDRRRSPAGTCSATTAPARSSASTRSSVQDGSASTAGRHHRQPGRSQCDHGRRRRRALRHLEQRRDHPLHPRLTTLR